MKNKILNIATLFFLALFIISCNSSNAQSNNKVITSSSVTTKIMIDNNNILKLENEIELIKNENIKLRDSVKYYRDSVTTINYLNARKIQKIKYYINITKKRPSNKKFFFGWIKRTIE